MYSIFDEKVLVCYASIGSYNYTLNDKTYQPVLIIEFLETNPKYRKKGHATKILTTIFDDHPNAHFVIEPTPYFKVHTLYAKLGFSLLYYDGGWDCYSLLKLAKKSKHKFSEISDAISENWAIEPCFNFDNSGVKWDNEKKLYPGYEMDEEDTGYKGGYGIKYDI